MYISHATTRSQALSLTWFIFLQSTVLKAPPQFATPSHLWILQRLLALSPSKYSPLLSCISRTLRCKTLTIGETTYKYMHQDRHWWIVFAPFDVGTSSGATTPTSRLKLNGFDAAAKTLCATFDVLVQQQLFTQVMMWIYQRSEFSSHPGSTVAISMAWAMHSLTAQLGSILMTAWPLSLLLISTLSLFTHHFIGCSLLIADTLILWQREC